MGKFQHDSKGETLTVVYYSPVLDNIILIYKREDGIFTTVDFEKTRMLVADDNLKTYILEKEYQLIGAFYEN